MVRIEGRREPREPSLAPAQKKEKAQERSLRSWVGGGGIGWESEGEMGVPSSKDGGGGWSLVREVSSIAGSGMAINFQSLSQEIMGLPSVTMLVVVAILVNFIKLKARCFGVSKG